MSRKRHAVPHRTTARRLRLRWILVAMLLVASAYLLLWRRNGPSVATTTLDVVEEPICIIRGEIPRQGSLYQSLLAEEVSADMVYQVVTSLNQIFDLRRSRPGDTYSLSFSEADSIVEFSYERGYQHAFTARWEDGAFVVREVQPHLDGVVTGLKGEITSSLWEAMIDHCRNPELILKFSDIFAWEIDFLTEPRRGDRFRMIFEERSREGKFVAYGDIIAADYRTKDTVYTAILYQDPSGRRDYYNLKGGSLRKLFLRSPLNFRRISSGFSHSRFHPILRIYRPHLGIDYAAPIGTKVVTTGDGTVAFAGWKGGFGKYIEVRHSGGFVTSYGHLSRFARGIKRGVKVALGQVIGYVGNTGLSTGPHLDYRLKMGGRFVNPLKVVLPAADPVKREYRGKFAEHRDALLAALDMLTEDILFTNSARNNSMP